MKKIYSLAIIIAMFSIVVGCKKGDTGPAGPAGPTGSSGPQGPQGNANVIAITFNVASLDWIQSNPIYYVDLNAPNITSDIVNTGTVQVFMQSTAQIGTWLNMPWIETTGSWFSTYNFVYGAGDVRVSKYDSDNTQTSNPGLRTFKVVAIAGSMIVANPDVDFTNYKQLKEKFNLPD